MGTPEAEAFLACRCGACRIDLCDATVRARTECLCRDCRKRSLNFALRRPENALPAAILNYERGVDLLYFANVLRVEEASRDRLEFSRLAPDAANITAMSTCCGTLMCGVHPMFGGNTISVNADSCRVTAPAHIDTQLVVFTCDAPAAAAKAIAAERGVPVISNVFQALEHPAILAFVNAIKAPIPGTVRSPDATSFEELCAGKTIRIDCPE